MRRRGRERERKGERGREREREREREGERGREREGEGGREREREGEREGERGGGREDLPWIAMTVMNTFSAAVVRISLGKIGVAGTHVTRSGKIDRFIDKKYFFVAKTL
jgi:hypothetical protein